MKDGLTAMYEESSAVRGDLMDGELDWEPRFHEGKVGEASKNPAWRGGLVLLLEPIDMVGSICFILCAALEDYWDFMDGTEVKEGELRVIGSINLSLIKAKSEPLPNRAERRLIR